MIGTRNVATAAAAALVITAAANAGTVAISGSDIGEFTMNSQLIEDVFGTESPWFSNQALNTVHNALHGDGINTDGVVTVLLAETDHGLTLMTLVDDNTQGSGWPWFDSALGVESTVHGDGPLFINDVLQDIQLYWNHDGSQTAMGTFIWDSDQHGDAMAWAGLDVGDEGDFNFVDLYGPGLVGDDTFQFVSWNGSAWEVVATGEFTRCGVFCFSFAIVPLPPALAVGLAGLAGVMVLRRRRAV